MSGIILEGEISTFTLLGLLLDASKRKGKVKVVFFLKILQN